MAESRTPGTLVVDISNTFTKFAVADSCKVGRVYRIPTADLSVAALSDAIRTLRFQRGILASVVPAKSRVVHEALGVDVLEVSAEINLGVGIRYPKPETIGADRLANAAAVVALFPLPAVVVDFGTAVTFDVVSSDGFYIGGVIAPGMAALTEYLHQRTALLPKVVLAKPPRVVGRSTREAMLSGAVIGYRGLIREILAEIATEQFNGVMPYVIATGGDASRISKLLPMFDAVAPGLTLEGLRRIAEKNPLIRERKNSPKSRNVSTTLPPTSKQHARTR